MKRIIRWFKNLFKKKTYIKPKTTPKKETKMKQIEKIVPEQLPIIYKHADALAKKHNWDIDDTRNLIKSLIIKESWDYNKQIADTWAVRFEGHWKWFKKIAFYAKLAVVSRKTEEICQMLSWGLMQVMGGVARERGFDTDMTELCIPENGIRIGVKHFDHYYKKYGNKLDTISAYNCGSPKKKWGKYSNQKYVDDVMEIYSDLKNGN